MFIQGSKESVGFYYVCWGRPGVRYDLNMYVTLNGLVKWMIGELWKEVPIIRIGRLIFTEEGVTEKDTWSSREEFLKWAKNLVGFHIPEGNNA